MTAPTQMTTHTLHGVKGWWHDHSLDFSAPLSAAIIAAAEDVHEGRVMSLNTDGTLGYGITTTKMALFLRNASYDKDVVNDGGAPATDKDAWVSVLPGGPGVGKLTALVATSATEIISTEYDSARSYDPGDTLTATIANKGLITNENAVVYTNPVCGVVSRGEVTNGHGVTGLAFWPVYMPTAS